MLTVLTYIVLSTLHYLMLCVNSVDMIALNTLHTFMLSIDSVDIDSIECIRNPCFVLTVLMYVIFDGMVEKPSVLAFQNFKWIEHHLNNKKVISKNVYVLCIDSDDIDSIECIRNPYVLY